MIVYNITIRVERSIDEAWLQWQKEEQIPAILETKLFTEYRIYKLMEQDEIEGNTYIIQLFANTAAQLQEFLQIHDQRLRENAFKKWGDRFISFRTTMELVK